MLTGFKYLHLTLPKGRKSSTREEAARTGARQACRGAVIAAPEPGL